MIMAGYYSGRKKLERSRDGEILGVCRGIAEWRDFPVGAVRLIFVFLVLFAGMSIWVYFILALILPIEPEYRGDRHQEDRNRRDKKASYDDVKADFDNLKERVNKMEDDELDKEKDWENRFSKSSKSSRG